MQTRFAKMFLKRMFVKSKFEFLYFLPTLPFPQNILKLWEEKEYQIFVVFFFFFFFFFLVKIFVVVVRQENLNLRNAHIKITFNILN